MKEVEYRVRPVTRYIVTRYHSGANCCGVETFGEFDNEAMACNAVLAFGDAETIQAQPAEKVITRRPMFGYEEVRTWRRGKGWDDSPAQNCQT